MTEEEELDKLSVEEWVKLMDHKEWMSHAVDLDRDQNGEGSTNDVFGTIDLFKD